MQCRTGHFGEVDQQGREANSNRAAAMPHTNYHAVAQVLWAIQTQTFVLVTNRKLSLDRIL